MGLNSVPSTCFDGSEILLPLGYEKGRRRETSAFSRSIANCGNHLLRWRKSQSLTLCPPRATSLPPRRRTADAISAQTLGCLSLSRRLG